MAMPTPAGTQQGRESSASLDWNQHLEGWSWEVSEPHPVMYSWVQFLLASRHKSPETTPTAFLTCGHFPGAKLGLRVGASRDPTLVYSTSGWSVQDPAQSSCHLRACTIYELQHKTLTGGMSKQN